MALRKSVVTALALALLGAAGCGGDDDNDGGGNDAGRREASVAGKALSVTEYREQGNAICTDALDKVEKIPKPRASDDLDDYLERSFDLSEDARKRFEALVPPPQLREDHQEAVRLGRDSNEQTEELIGRVREADDPAATLLEEFEKLLESAEFKRSEEITRRLKLSECLQLGVPGQEAAPA